MNPLDKIIILLWIFMILVFIPSEIYPDIEMTGGYKYWSNEYLDFSNRGSIIFKNYIDLKNDLFKKNFDLQINLGLDYHKKNCHLNSVNINLTSY